MQTKPIYLSSKSKISFYFKKYNIEQNTFWQGQHVFEISDLSPKQLNILNTLNDIESPFFDIYTKTNKNIVLLHFLYRNPNKEIIKRIENEDNELGEFFDHVVAFFSDRCAPVWKMNKKTLDFNQAPFIMGILNVTPDSFSDGGNYCDLNGAVDHALNMIESGADIIDIGGESTRPGSDVVSMEEEMQRVLPVIEAIRKYSDVLISIDSYKSEVADNAIKVGADIINDISACTFDVKMTDIVKKHDCPIVLMHIKGTPKNMQLNPEYNDVCLEVYQLLSKQIKFLVKKGIDKIIVDPGIGFGKRLEDNLQILNNLECFKFLCQPVLIGASRKSFLGHVLGKEVDQRLYGSLSVAVLSAIKGADIIRVHDVSETRDALKILETIYSTN